MFILFFFSFTPKIFVQQLITCYAGVQVPEMEQRTGVGRTGRERTRVTCRLLGARTHLGESAKQR